MRKIMSRRKQSNPKPLLKREDEDFVEETSTQADDGETPSDTAQSGSPTPTATPVQSPSACSTPALSPGTETPELKIITIEQQQQHQQQQNNNREIITTTTTTNTTQINALPKLRLNTILASDPALQPEAKDIKNIRVSTEDNLDNNKLDDDYNDHHSQHHHHQQHHRHPQQTHSIILEHNNDLKEIPPRHKERTNNIITPSSTTTATIRASPNIDMPPRVPVYMCEPCGIRFSSLSTLEAHQTYYCSHRKDADENSSSSKPSSTTETGITEPTIKSIKTGKQYACTQCSYSADKKVSLNRHMRMHQTSPAPSSNTSNGDDPPSQIPQVDRYCSDCDIRFSSTKTYRAHKQHYCSSRHREGQPNTVTTPKPPSIKGGSQSPPEIAPKSPTPNPPQPYLALPTNPIVIVPYSFVRSASVLTGPLSSIAPGVTNPETTCFILQNGSLQPIAVSLTTSTSGQTSQSQNSSSTSRVPTPISLSSSTIQQPASVENNNVAVPITDVIVNKTSHKRDLTTRDSITTPLDLSVRRMSSGSNCIRERTFSFSSMASLEHLDTIIDNSKDNISIGSESLTPEQIVCAPSLPGSPPLTPSPKRRRSNSPRCSTISISPTNSSILSTIQQQQQQHQQHQQHHHQQQQPILIRPLLPADLALRLNEQTLNSISPQLLTKQSVELALRLSSTTTNNMTTTINNNNSNNNNNNNNNNNELISPQQTPPLINLITNSKTTKITTTGSGSVNSGGSIIPPIQTTIPPQIFVKQGVSKCKECNIVFCKYENYLAHKKHYCSARNLLDDTDSINNKQSPPVSPQSTSPSGGGGGGGIVNIGGNVNIGGTPLAYQQLICAACGIKFTSLDNLNAHQMYYCPKRIEIPIQQQQQQQQVQTTIVKERCGKCKSVHELGQACIPGQGTYKCPICDVLSTSSTELRKHMETHGGVKAFRCSICRYKGNTLRGMRTHIRMHFDKKTSDFNEENYITCILEEDGVEVVPPAATTQVVTNNESLAQLHYCDMCNYSSSYKGNVVRHIKLVHSQTNQHINSQTVGEGGESLIHNGGELQKTNNNLTRIMSPQQQITVKIEPEEMLNNENDDNDNHDTTEHIIIDEPVIQIKAEIKEQSDLLITTSSSSSSSSSSSNSSIIKQNNTRRSSLSSPDLIITPTIITTTPTTTSSSTTQNLSSAVSGGGGGGPKYCKTCDIKFNYMNTFAAHKKFYCKSRINERDTGSSPTQPNVVARATEASVL